MLKFTRCMCQEINEYGLTRTQLDATRTRRRLQDAPGHFTGYGAGFDKNGSIPQELIRTVCSESAARSSSGHHTKPTSRPSWGKRNTVISMVSDQSYGYFEFRERPPLHTWITCIRKHSTALTFACLPMLSNMKLTPAEDAYRAQVGCSLALIWLHFLQIPESRLP